MEVFLAQVYPGILHFGKVYIIENGQIYNVTYTGIKIPVTITQIR